MTGSDIFLNTLECNAIFEGAAILESCCGRWPDRGVPSLISCQSWRCPQCQPSCPHAHLQSLTCVIMPRRHNKYHARVKRHQVRRDTQCPQEAQASAAAAAEEECPSSPSSVPQGSPLSSPAAGESQKVQGAMAPSSPDAGASWAGSDEGAQGPEEESAGASQAAPATQSTLKDPLTRKANMLVEFLLEKYGKKEPITQNALLTVVNRKYRQHFPEILRRASERMVLVFGLELKEDDRSRNIYVLISKLNHRGNGGPSDEKGLPKSGLLMVLLGVIFMKGNRATEEEVWEFLSVLGVYAGRRHSIFGEPRRLITKDLVQKKYLKYLQVPNSDPPRYEFLWGPRACAEISKMKVLEVLAKIHDTVPSAFPDLYDEALRDQAERAGLRVATQAPAMAEASAPSRAKSCSSSHI
ncbi:melanoma-associated antigen B17-like [Cervus canadensis]|uniref:melanoma-associated antigen B17-like n=2 Tax=Cervus TaxID=9859 RepID=UPI001CA3426B|nr:melanoma-associated antigen B17-like [Cervus canadensis]